VRRGRLRLALLVLVVGVLATVFVAPAVQSAMRDGGAADPAGPAEVSGGATGSAVAAGPLPDVPARSFAVYDATTRKVLASRGLDEEVPVASITKLMTASLVLAHGGLDEPLAVPPVETARGESVAGLEAGETLTRRQLLALLLIPSAGDAAEALAVTTGTSRAGFVERMNARARAFGLRHTRYANPAGLDAPGQYSTARDTVVLAARMMRSATVRTIVRRTEARLHGRTLPATNHLLDTGLGIDGVKTGHTDGAGWCIVVSAMHRGHRLVIAVLGARDESPRDEAVRALLLWAQAADR
jgi:D-alanyl-D-alanine carboxypeptidase (penicillin-binding protein 5/6)